MDRNMVEVEARHFSTRLAKLIAEEANKKAEDERGAFAGTAASMILQNVICSMVITRHEPGSAAGEAEIRTLYEEALKDAVARWHKEDLKERRRLGYI